MRFITSLVLLGLGSIASAQTVSFTINTSQTSSISPYIYGINGTINSGGFNNLTLTRREATAGRPITGPTTTPTRAAIGIMRTTTP